MEPIGGGGSSSNKVAGYFKNSTLDQFQNPFRNVGIEFSSGEPRELVIPFEVVAAWDSFKRYFAPRSAADGVSSGGEESGDSDSESGNETPKGPFTYSTSVSHCRKTAASLTLSSSHSGRLICMVPYL